MFQNLHNARFQLLNPFLQNNGNCTISKCCSCRDHVRSHKCIFHSQFPEFLFHQMIPRTHSLFPPAFSAHDTSDFAHLNGKFGSSPNEQGGRWLITQDCKCSPWFSSISMSSWRISSWRFVTLSLISLVLNVTNVIQMTTKENHKYYTSGETSELSDFRM